jgi:hypothetical protein
MDADCGELQLRDTNADAKKKWGTPVLKRGPRPQPALPLLNPRSVSQWSEGMFPRLVSVPALVWIPVFFRHAAVGRAMRGPRAGGAREGFPNMECIT